MICHNGEPAWPSWNTYGQPGEGSPTLHSIGVSLGRLARFGGHTETWYPVLAHVFVVAALMPGKTAIYGLMHDAAESCCGDVPTPWKTQAAIDTEMELLERIYRAHDLMWPVPPAIAAEVDRADRAAQCAEAFVLGHPGAGTHWKDPDPRAVKLTQDQRGYCRQYLEADVAGPAMQRCFEQLRDLSLAIWR